MNKEAIVEPAAKVAANGILGGLMILTVGGVLKVVDMVVKPSTPAASFYKLGLAVIATGYTWRAVEKQVIYGGTAALKKLNEVR